MRECESVIQEIRRTTCFARRCRFLVANIAVAVAFSPLAAADEEDKKEGKKKRKKSGKKKKEGKNKGLANMADLEPPQPPPRAPPPNSAEPEREPIPAPSILFLGTGSSQPSPHRNVSSTLVSLDDSTSILLDCGESTVAQILAVSDESALSRIKLVWISHPHADHCMGLRDFLRRRATVAADTVTVVCPKGVGWWLEGEDCKVIKCESFTGGKGEAEGMDFMKR